MAAADLSKQGANSGGETPRRDMDHDRDPGALRARIRWGNVVKAVAVAGLVAAVVAWPRLSSDAPALPREDATAPRVDVAPVPDPAPPAQPAEPLTDEAPPAVKERPAEKKKRRRARKK